MGIFGRRVLAVIGTAALWMTAFGSCIASADPSYDPLVGKTYSDATAFISKYDGKPVVASVIGGDLQKEDCVVTSWHMSKYLNSSGKNDRGDEWLLSLNCNNRLASPGKPGNSAVSPEGVLAKSHQESAEKISKDPSICYQKDSYMEWCKVMCNETGLCTI